MEIIHWDDAPFGTGFAVSQFEDGPNPGWWGIIASLPDNRLVWVALGSPSSMVEVPNRDMAESILANLRDFSKMKKVAEEMGNWGDDNPTGLPDPRTLPTVNWREVPRTVGFQERQFRNRIWGVVALMPDGEHLVMLDRFAQDAGFNTFSASQAAAQGVVDWLEITKTPADPESKVEVRVNDAAPAPPFVPEVLPDGPLCEAEPAEASDFLLLASLDQQMKVDQQSLQELEKEWRRRLAVGKLKSCLCGQCRHEIRTKVTRIIDWYGRPTTESEQDVKELILDAYRLMNLLAVP